MYKIVVTKIPGIEQAECKFCRGAGSCGLIQVNSL